MLTQRGLGILIYKGDTRDVVERECGQVYLVKMGPEVAAHPDGAHRFVEVSHDFLVFFPGYESTKNVKINFTWHRTLLATWS